MRLVGFSVVVSMLAVAGLPSAAQSQSHRPGQAYSSQLQSSWQLADNQQSIQQQLAKARAQERNSGCRWIFGRSRSSVCRSIRARISALERQLRTGKPAVPSYSSVRTICVRVCDGYYYTMSHTNSRKRISQDAEKCAGQYPPDEAVLFYHRFPSDDVSQARTLDGKRYADQDYAFAFRKAFMPHCAAQLQQGLAALRSRVFAAVPTLLQERPDGLGGYSPPTEAVPIARARPHRSVDPETLANRAGDLTPEPLDPAVAGMRIVGDPYYFVEGNPASALNPARKTPGGRSRDVPSDGPY
jgi:hypothetical protein